MTEEGTEIAMSIQSRGCLQDVMRTFIGRPLDLPMSALIQKASYGYLMDLDILWILGYPLFCEFLNLMSGRVESRSLWGPNKP